MNGPLLSVVGDELFSLWQKRRAMRSEQPVRCAKCYLRMQPNELRTVHHKRTYHQHCFLMVIREKADREQVARLEAGAADGEQRISA